MEKIQIQLSVVQNRLVAPKSEFNKFGGYAYRSCEGILNAVKPLLEENSLNLTISDEVVNIGERYYVKATATVTNLEGMTISVSAYAREDQSLKGMNESQITGSTSSYARKYDLNGLFCIDDTKDSDATNTHKVGAFVDAGHGKKTEGKVAPDKPTDTNDLTCSSCGKAITAAVKTFSVQKLGKPLCRDCQKK